MHMHLSRIYMSKWYKLSPFFCFSTVIWSSVKAAETPGAVCQAGYDVAEGGPVLHAAPGQSPAANHRPRPQEHPRSRQTDR